MSDTQTLTPPDQSVLTPPAPVAPVQEEQAVSQVPMKPEDRQRMDDQADQFVDKVLSADSGSEDLQELVNSVHAMGNADIEAVVNASSRFMGQPVKTLRDAGDEGSRIASAMTNLRMKADELNPANRDLTGARKLLGFIPMGSKIQSYFMEYQDSQTYIKKILDDLEEGKDTLMKDNIEIEQEKVRLWDLMGKLQNLAYLSKVLDDRLDARLTEFEAQNPDKARVVREEVQFYLRQKRTDLLTQLAVAIQGYLVMDMGRKINLDLIKGVDRARNTTVYALSVAVKAAQMLANQKLVLNQIDALNKTTEQLIAGVGTMTKNNAAQVAQHAGSATVSVDVLKQAFADIYEAIDTVADYKLKALEGLKQSADTLQEEVTKARSYTDKARQGVVEEFQAGEETTKLLSA